MNIDRWMLFGICSLAVAACGGGGGGQGGAAPSPPSAGGPASGYSLGGRFVPDAELGEDVLFAGHAVLSWAQFGTDIAHRFAGADSPSSVTVNCARTGRVTLLFEDRDGNGRASAGDTVTAVLEDCGVPVLARTISGTLRLDILSGTRGVETELRARLSMADGVGIAAMNTGTNIGPVHQGLWQGSLGIHWSESESSQTLRASSLPDDDLRFTATGRAFTSAETLTHLDVWRSVQYDSATISSSMAYEWMSGTATRLRVSTPQPFVGDLNVAPRQYRVEVDLPGGSRLRLERGSDSIARLIQTSIVSSNGAVGSASQLLWGEFKSLMKDPRHDSPVDTWLEEGWSYVSMTPWRGSALGRAIDSVCRQGSSDPHFRADALFQRPVAPEPSLTEPGGVIRLQFRRPIAYNADLAHFRMADDLGALSGNVGLLDPDMRFWHTTTEVTQRGSYLEIRLTEPLRQGRLYYLQSSPDGIEWIGQRVVLDLAGQTVTSGPSGFASFRTDGALVASFAVSDTGSIAPESPARLTVVAVPARGQTLVRSHWEQLSGPRVNLTELPRLEMPEFDNRQIIQADVALAEGGDRLVDDAIIQLTVTDELGNSDRSRWTVKLGSVRPQGAVWYTETADPPILRRNMEVGPGSFLPSPEPGLVSPRVLAADQAGTGVSFSVRPANGQRLRPGTYVDAIREVDSGDRNGLLSSVFCSSTDSAVSGSFEVLEADYGEDGTIRRLAIDYVQQCEDGLREYQRGSYRYNSAIPLTR